MNKFLIGVCLALACFAANSQVQKIGYIKVDRIYAEWPKAINSQKDLITYENNLQSRLQAKINDFQVQLAAYKKNAPTMNASERQGAEAELENLNTQIQQFQSNAQQSINEKKASMQEPLQNDLNSAISKVAAENGYTFIFTYGSSLVFSSDKKADVSSQVAQKLGFELP